MIDMSTYRKIHKENDTIFHIIPEIESQRKKYDNWPTEKDSSQTVDDELLMLLPPHIPGFEMQTKKWGTSTFAFSTMYCERTC